MVKRLITNWEEYARKQSWRNLRYYRGICQDNIGKANPGSSEYKAEMLVVLKRCRNHNHRSATPAEEQVTITYTIFIGLGQKDTLWSLFGSRHHYHGRVHVIPPRGKQTPATSLLLNTAKTIWLGGREIRMRPRKLSPHTYPSRAHTS